MARNEVYRDGDRLALPVPDGTVSGAPVLVGALPGVTQTGRAADGTATVWTSGAFRLDVAGAVTTVGSPVYITSAGALTTTATGNTVFGHALATKGAGTGPLVVKIAKV